MDKNFSDIFESINGLHKKYSSKEYIETIEKFDAESKELIKILEKYKIKKKDKQKINFKDKKKNIKKNVKKNRISKVKHRNSLKKIEAV